MLRTSKRAKARRKRSRSYCSLASETKIGKSKFRANARCGWRMQAARSRPSKGAKRRVWVFARRSSVASRSYQTAFSTTHIQANRSQDHTSNIRLYRYRNPCIRPSQYQETTPPALRTLVLIFVDPPRSRLETSNPLSTFPGNLHP